MAPIWEDIAETLDQEVNVAEVVFCGMVELKIDATMQEKLARRFNVDGFPLYSLWKMCKLGPSLIVRGSSVNSRVNEKNKLLLNLLELDFPVWMV